MASFEKAFEIVLKNEGGYVNDIHDRGGETKYGISKRSYPEVDIENLTIEGAKEIYKNDYWDNLSLDEWQVSDEIIYKVFDLGVNMGSKKSVALLQLAVNSMIPYKLVIDGVYGTQTGNAIIEVDQTNLLYCYKSAAASYYYGLNNKRYLNGWLKRAYS